MFEPGSKIVFIENGEDQFGEAYSKGVAGIIIKVGEDGSFTIDTQKRLFKGIPKNHIDTFSANIDLAVNAKLDADEESRSVKDSENRIVYAKKYKAAYSKINLQTLSEIEENEGLAESLVTKDKVFPKINVQDLRDAGVNSATAWLIVKLREVLPQKPNTSTPEARRVFIFYTQYIQANFLEGKIKTVSEFKSILKKMYEYTIRNFLIAADKEDGTMIDRVALQMDAWSAAIQLLTEHAFDLMRDLEVLEEEIIARYGAEAIDQAYSLKNTGNLKARLELKEPEELVQRYTELTDQISAIYHSIDKGKREFILPIEIEAVDAHNNSLTSIGTTGPNIDNYYIQNYINGLLRDIFGEKFAKYLKGGGYYASKSQSESYYTQAEKFLPIEQGQRESLETQLDEVKDQVIAFSVLKKKLQSTDVNELYQLFKTLRETSSALKYYLPFEDIGFFYRREGHQVVRLVLSTTGGWKKSNTNVYRSPEGADEILFYAKKAAESLDEKLTQLNKRVEEIAKELSRTEENWRWSDTKKGKATGPKVDITINSQTPLDHIERTNALKLPDFKTNTDIQDFFKETLGMTRLTFGKYVTDKERMAHAQHFAMSMIDYCEVLNWDIKDFTKQFNLGIGIGASGSGKASATYMHKPAAFVNLTKRNGDGALAHELSHYVDNFMAKSGMGTECEIGTASSRYLSHCYTTDNDQLNNLIFDFLSFVKFGWVPNWLSIDLTNQYKQYKDEVVRKMDAEGLLDVKGRRGRVGSIYFMMSSKLSSYWTKNVELFARACECYFFDKLAERDMSNNYLVSGEYFESAYGVYPESIERKVTNLLLDKIFAQIKVAKGISDFSFGTTERIDNFIALKSDKSEVEVAEVEVDSDVDERKEQAEKTLDEFIQMLESKFDKGGAISSIVEINKKYQYANAG